MGGSFVGLIDMVAEVKFLESSRPIFLDSLPTVNRSSGLSVRFLTVGVVTPIISHVLDEAVDFGAKTPA
jgi:hypothetical protein